MSLIEKAVQAQNADVPALAVLLIDDATALKIVDVMLIKNHG